MSTSERMARLSFARLVASAAKALYQSGLAPLSVGTVCALGEGEKSQSASRQTRSRRGLGPVNVTERKTNVILVECLTCRHQGMIFERELVRFGLKPGMPIGRFVKRLRCRKCGSGSVMARRTDRKSTRLN